MLLFKEECENVYLVLQSDEVEEAPSSAAEAEASFGLCKAN